MPNYRVVVVYPQVEEAVAAYWQVRGMQAPASLELRYGLDEVMQLVNLLGAQLLTGQDANILGILRILSEPTDILWLITHGVEEGWFLKDGIVTASETTSLVRSSNIFLTVMNSCSSFEVAQTVADELGTAFISTVTEVPDRQAFITGVLFARHLASGLDYVAAWERAKPGQRHPYVLIEAKGMQLMNPRDRGGSSEDLDPTALRRFIDSVRELERIIFGDSRLGLPPMREMTSKLQRDLDELRNKDLPRIEAQLTEIVRRQDSRTRWIILQSIVTVILAIIVGVIVLFPEGVFK